MRVLRIVLAFQAITVAIWLGGLVVLGAIVAPTVFGMVPAPASADAMTVVFQRFDKLAMTAAVLAMLCEVAGAKLRRETSLLDLARGLFLALMAALAIVEGAALSPKIADLHRRGAIRGDGDLGAELETVHTYAEIASKAQLALGLAFFGLLVAPPPAAPAPLPPPAPVPEPTEPVESAKKERDDEAAAEASDA